MIDLELINNGRCLVFVQYLLAASSALTIILLLMFGIYLARPIKTKGELVGLI